MGDGCTAEALRERMRSRHGIDASHVRFVRAPYRICPLGAHIDHQLGTVTAMAIDHGVLLAYAPSGSAEVVLSSAVYPGEVRFRIDAIPPKHAGDWGNYACGAAMALSRAHGLKHGLVGITSGDLAEVGLSSSASVGVTYLLALEAVNGLEVSPGDNIRLDQAIENEYLGLNNGILDQAAILLSRRNQLTVIDCRAFARVDGDTSITASASGDLPRGMSVLDRPESMPHFSILIAVSGLTQAIISTDYNRRVAECVEAAQVLLDAAGRRGVPARLGMLSHEEYETHRGALSGAPAKRAEHFFGEMRRVRLGQEAWRRGDLTAFGALVTESGRSSIVNYECGCDPLIDLYEILIATPGVLGARFSGAGFRGCCVALVEPEAGGQIIPRVRHAYAARHPELAKRAQYLICQTDDGARLL